MTLRKDEADNVESHVDMYETKEHSFALELWLGFVNNKKILACARIFVLRKRMMTVQHGAATMLAVACIDVVLV